MDFFTVITSFPVIIFTFLLGIVFFYWVLVIVGMMDLEIFDIGGELGEGGESSHFLGGILANWGLSGVPFTIVASILTSSSWFLSALVTATLFPHLPSPQLRLLAGIGLLVVVVAISIPFTAKMVKPMRRIFRTNQASHKSAFVGRDCVVKTLAVTNTFGQGEIFDGEAGILIDITANEPNDIVKGDIVILVEYDADKESYFVAKG